MNAEQIASEVYNWFGSACGEMAYGSVDIMTGKPTEFCDQETKKKLVEAKKDGVTDLAGWLADELFNDPNSLDMVADHIGDMSYQYGISKHDIWEAFHRYLPSKLKYKCDEFIDRYKEEEAKQRGVK